MAIEGKSGSRNAFYDPTRDEGWVRVGIDHDAVGKLSSHTKTDALPTPDRQTGSGNVSQRAKRRGPG